MRSESVFSPGSLQAYLSLVLLCGTALVFSIQPATRIATLRASGVAYPPHMFHLAVALVFGLFAANRGAVVAAAAASRAIRSRVLGQIAMHLGFGYLLLVPYLVYARSLTPHHAAVLPLLSLYLAVEGLFVSLAAILLERRGRAGNRHGFLLRYGMYLGLCLIPVGVGLMHPSVQSALTVSPVGMATSIVGAPSAVDLTVGFAFPAAGIVWLLHRLRRFDGRHHAV